MRLAVILVHYHTPDLAAAALDALRADVAGTGLEVEWLIVDNGSDTEERAKLETLPARLIGPGRNLGYAGGVNLGVAQTQAELILLMNPDVIVLPGCVPALVDQLKDGASIAGPAFFWDRERRMLLPPAERRTRRDELAAILARRGEGWAAQARRRWRRHARRHWEAHAPLPSHDLSGSLIALSRPAWETVGPFDEGFQLFFEETDWLLRARDRGVPSWYVPGAQAVHLYNQSAGKEPKAKGWFEDSARRFRRRHYGPWFAESLENLDNRLPRRSGPRLAPASQLDLPKAPVWVEVSPNPEGFPAAAERVLEPGIWRLPQEIREPGLIAQVTDADGREILRRSLETEE